MRVQEIHFNHNRGSASGDAINLRVNGGSRSVIVAPEFVDGRLSRPAAYARDELAGTVAIKAKFVDGPPNQTLNIQAIETSNSVLGNTGWKSVQFDAMGKSGLELFKIAVRLDRAPIGISQQVWVWHFQDLAGGAVPFMATSHRIYMVTALPTAPWCQGLAEPPGRQFPWASALDKACVWAGGLFTTGQAAQAIATMINAHPKHVYDESGTEFVDELTGDFLLTDYLSALDNAASLTLDCRGATTAMIAMANLLGADLRPLLLRNLPLIVGGPRGKFTTHPVLALSDPPWQPNWWSWHEIAAVETSLVDALGNPLPMVAQTELPLGPDQGVLVYDAGLQMDQLSPVLPMAMPLGSVGVSGYRHQLIQAGSFDSAAPGNRRPVV